MRTRKHLGRVQQLVGLSWGGGAQGKTNGPGERLGRAMAQREKCVQHDGKAMSTPA